MSFFLETPRLILREMGQADLPVRRNGMLPVARFVKHYYGIDMPHIVFVVRWKPGA